MESTPTTALQLRDVLVPERSSLYPQVIAFMGEAGTIKAPLPPAERFVDLQYLHAAGAQ